MFQVLLPQSRNLMKIFNLIPTHFIHEKGIALYLSLPFIYHHILFPIRGVQCKKEFSWEKNNAEEAPKPCLYTGRWVRIVSLFSLFMHVWQEWTDKCPLRFPNGSRNTLCFSFITFVFSILHNVMATTAEETERGIEREINFVQVFE